MKLQNIDLNKFKALYWLYHEGSLLKASYRMNLTPSAVRQSIKTLEKNIGLQLFITSGKSYVPTKEATDYLNLISPFFENLEEKLADHNDQRKNLKGELIIGSPFVYSYDLLAKLAHKFIKKHPDVNIEIVSSGTSFLVEKVLSNEFDFAICNNGPEVIHNNKLIHIDLSEDYLVLCHASKEIDTKDRILTYKELTSLPHIAYSSNHYMLERWYRYHFNKCPKLTPNLKVNNVPAIKEMVLAGAGLGVLPYSYIKNDITKGRIKIIETKKKMLTNNRVLIQNAEKVPSLLEKTFIKFLSK